MQTLIAGPCYGTLPNMAKTSPVKYAAKAAGSKYRLAQLCGVGAQAVQHWDDSGRIPARHVVTIARALRLPCSRLRPDLYPIDLCPP
jgi:DNA-binding transcriptional regulator YdaS (Cro superfamily)